MRRAHLDGRSTATRRGEISSAIRLSGLCLRGLVICGGASGIQITENHSIHVNIHYFLPSFIESYCGGARYNQICFSELFVYRIGGQRAFVCDLHFSPFHSLVVW